MAVSFQIWCVLSLLVHFVFDFFCAVSISLSVSSLTYDTIWLITGCICLGLSHDMMGRKNFALENYCTSLDYMMRHTVDSTYSQFILGLRDFSELSS